MNFYFFGFSKHLETNEELRIIFRDNNYKFIYVYICREFVLIINNFYV